MISTKAKYGFFSLLIALVVITYWRNIFLISLPSNIGWLNLISLLSVGFFILNIAAAIGLFLMKRWAFVLAYIAIIFSTIFFATPYIPFVISVFSRHFQYAAMITINIVVIIGIAYLQKTKTKK